MTQKQPWTKLTFDKKDTDIDKVRAKYIAFIDGNDPWLFGADFTYRNRSRSVLATMKDEKMTMQEMKKGGEFLNKLGDIYEQRTRTHSAYRPKYHPDGLPKYWTDAASLGIDNHDTLLARKEKMLYFFSENAPEMPDKMVQFASGPMSVGKLIAALKSALESTGLLPGDPTYEKIKKVYDENYASSRRAGNNTNDDADVAPPWPLLPDEDRKELPEDEVGARKEAIKQFLDNAGIVGRETLRQEMDFAEADDDRNVRTFSQLLTTDEYDAPSNWYEPANGETTLYVDLKTMYNTIRAGGPITMREWPLKSEADSVPITKKDQASERIQIVRAFLEANYPDAFTNKIKVKDTEVTIADCMKLSEYTIPGEWYVKKTRHTVYGRIKFAYNRKRLHLDIFKKENTDIVPSVPQKAPKVAKKQPQQQNDKPSPSGGDDDSSSSDEFTSLSGDDDLPAWPIKKDGKKPSNAAMNARIKQVSEFLHKNAPELLERKIEITVDEFIKVKEAFEVQHADPANWYVKQKVNSIYSLIKDLYESYRSGSAEESSSDADADDDKEGDSSAVDEEAVKKQLADTVVRNDIEVKQLVVALEKQLGDPAAAQHQQQLAHDVSAQVQKLQNEVASLKAVNEGLRREHEADETLKGELRRAREKAEVDARDLRAQLEAAKSGAGKATVTGGALQTQLQEARGALDEMTRASQENERRADEQLKRAENLEDDLKSVKRELTSAKNETSKQLQRVGKLSAEIDDLTAENIAKTQEIAQLRTGGITDANTLQQLNEKDQQIQKLAQQVTALQSEKLGTVRRDEYDIAIRERDEARDGQRQIQGKLDNATRQLNELQKTNTRLSETNQRLRHDVTESASSNQAELQQLRQELALAKEQQKAQSAKLQTYDTDLANARKTSKGHEGRATQAEERANALQVELKAEKERYAALLEVTQQEGGTPTEVLAEAQRALDRNERLKLEQLARENTALKQKVDRFAALDVFKVGTTTHEIASSGRYRDPQFATKQLVLVSKKSFDYIRHHWAFYRLLRIGGDDERGRQTFASFVDEHRLATPAPNERSDHNGAGRFFYRVLDDDYQHALMRDAQHSMDEDDDEPGARRYGGAAHPMTLGDYAMQSHIDGALATAPPVGNNTVEVQFRDESKRTVLGFVAQQLAVHTLPGNNQVLIVDMAQLGDQLRYTHINALGPTLIGSRGSVRIVHSQAGQPPQKRVYALAVQAPPVVDPRYAYGQESVVPLGASGGELLLSYATPRLSALKRLVLPYRGRSGGAVVADAGADDIVVVDDNEGEQEPVVISSKPVVTISVSEKTGPELLDDTLRYLGEKLPQYQWFSSSAYEVMALDVSKRIFLTRIGAPEDVYTLTADQSYRAYNNGVRAPLIIALVNGSRPLPLDQYDMVHQLLRNGPRITNTDGAAQARMARLAAQLDAGVEFGRPRQDRTTDPSSTGTTDAFFDFTSGAAEIYEIVQYGTVAGANGLLDDDDSVFDAISTWQ